MIKNPLAIKLEQTLKEMVGADKWHKQVTKMQEAFDLVDSKKEIIGKEGTRDIKEKITELFEMNKKPIGGRTK